MKKIIVLGNSGSGKSTFTANLSKKTNIESLHLDPIVFKYSWDSPNFEELQEKVAEIIKKDSWIIDGNFLNKAVERFDNCDTIFFLDINRFTCLFSVIKRHRKYKGKHRDSRSDYCDEKLSKAYLKWVFFDFYKSSRKIIKEYISNCNNKNVIVFKSRKMINKYLKGETLWK